jgi:acyl-coenzyme A thioesterase PaaI-like protein
MSLFLKSLKELPPFGQALGMVLDEADSEPGVAVLLPGAEHLSGHADDGVFHTGVILATIDNTAGWCIRDHRDYAEGTSMATLDLRVDFVNPASLSETLRVRAVCEGFDGDIAFVRATAETTTTKVLIATGQATFMLGTSSTPNPATASKVVGGAVE